MSTTMRAVVCDRVGPYAGALRLGTAPAPGPPPPGALKVRVVCAGVSFPDLLQVEGKYQRKRKPPFVPVEEIAGEVLAVGAGVTGWSAGDRVAGWAADDGDGHICGGLAEQGLVDAGRCWKIPAEIDDRTAVAMVRNYNVVHSALVDHGGLRRGETLMVLGAAGACGLAAIDIAKALGARVVACASSAAKVAACRDAGADVAVDYERGGGRDFLPALREAKVYGKVDVVFDPVGGRYAEQGFRAMGRGGRFVVFGFAGGGTDPKSAFPTFPVNLLLMRGQQIIGAMGARRPETAMPELVAMAAGGALRPLRAGSRTYQLEEFRAAFDDLAARRAIGKVIVSVAAPVAARL